MTLMARKRALIVDDSKSARIILSRMLEKYDIEVDMSESAEQAIQYLQQNRPDAIFMDHLMPGMDGLQAVQAIKGNPQTATIPIMMYTSQEGELYVGQARALGAMGVLPKQVRPVDVSKVLYELHLLPDRRDWSAPALEPVEIDPASGVAKLPTPETVEAGAPAIDWGRRLELAIKDQGVDLRRFVVASMDSFATRIISDVREMIRAPSLGFSAMSLAAPVSADTSATAPGAAQPGATAANSEAADGMPAARAHWPWLAGLAAAVLAAAVFGTLWASTRAEMDRILAQVTALTAANAELKHSQQDLTDTIKELSTALSSASAASALTGAAGGAMAANAGTSGMASIVRTEPVPYGETSLDRTRLEVLRDLLTKLEAQGFRGVVKVTSHSGAFCLMGNATDGFSVAPGATPLAKCDMLGNPFEETLTGAQRQSVAFANLVASARQRSGGAITVSMENAGGAHAAAAYPARAESTTAAEWNKAATANNRVEISVEPGAG